MVIETRDSRILLSVGAGLAQRVAQILAAMITLPVALHVLGVSQFGVWGAATSIAWLAGMLDFGLGSALVTLVPRALAGGRTAQARAHVTAALLGGVTLGAGILVLSAIAMARADSRETALPFVIAGVGLALNVPFSIAQNIWFGLQKGYVAGAWELLQSVLSLTLLLAVAALGGGVAALVSAIYAGMVLANAGSLTHLLLSRPNLRPQFRRISLTELRAVIAPGSVLFSIGACGACAYVFDNILALEWMGPVAAAQTAVTLRVCTTALAFLASLTQPFWPAFVEAAARDDRTWERRSLQRGTLATAGCAAGGALLLVAFGKPALVLWLHADLHLSPGLFWTMAAWIIALGLPRMAGLLLNAVSILRFQLAVVSVAAVAAFGMKFLFARRFGVAGIVAATPCAWVAIVWPSYAWRAWRWIARLNHAIRSGHVI
jgi:O-antigen/teichoic acid export membrane protein